MIVPEFIEWLLTQDQTAKIEVLAIFSHKSYPGGDYAKRVDFNSYHLDMRGRADCNNFGKEPTNSLILGGQ